MGFLNGLLLFYTLGPLCLAMPTISDQSVKGYLTEVGGIGYTQLLLTPVHAFKEGKATTTIHFQIYIYYYRTCWWNEICKEEFQIQFKCKCPLWSFCRSEGRYYSAYCSMTNTGYIWAQPDRSWSLGLQTRAVSKP